MKKNSMFWLWTDWLLQGMSIEKERKNDLIMGKKDIKLHIAQNPKVKRGKNEKYSLLNYNRNQINKNEKFCKFTDEQ